MSTSPAVAALTRALNARKTGGGWMAKCIVHDDRTPSLSISEGRDGVPLFHCHGGCSQAAVIDALRKRGLWHDGAAGKPTFMQKLAQSAPTAAGPSEDEQKTIADCRRAWDAAVPAENTNAQLYLQCRGIVSSETPLPPSLRYLENKNALVAAVTKPNSEELVGLHCIFLEEDEAGVWKKNKLSFGPVRLGHVKLAPPDTKMQVTESLEDGLALMQMNGVPTLAVPGTSFLAGHFVPPKECRIIVVAPDNDEAGRQAISAAAPRLSVQGFYVRELLPPPHMDWCDVLPEFEERRAIVEEESYG